MDLKSKVIMITGATSGIGEATARLLADKGCGRLILVGRRQDRLTALADDLRHKGSVEVYTVSLDVRDRTDVEKAIKDIPDSYRTVDVLVNNAGLAAGLDSFEDSDVNDWERMIDTNVKGLLYVSHAIIPYMIERGHGHIINIASIAGKEVYPKGHVYCATKHAVDALTRSMRLDLTPKGIKVSQIAPGAVNTEFSTVRFHGDRDRADQVYNGYKPLVAEDVAECLCFMISAPDHVNIADMLILPSAQSDSRNFVRE